MGVMQSTHMGEGLPTPDVFNCSWYETSDVVYGSHIWMKLYVLQPRDGARNEAVVDDDDSYPALGDSSGIGRHQRGTLQHINFFEDIEKKLNKRNGPNADKTREKKKEEEAHLKKIGALV